MEQDIKPTYIMSENKDISSFVASTYTVFNKIKENIGFDKTKSLNLLQMYLQGKQVHEEENDKWAKHQIVQNSIKNPNQILRYQVDPYIEIYKFLINTLQPKLQTFTKADENKYSSQLYFSVCRIITDVTPSCNYLGLTYRLLDQNKEQVLKFKFSPFFNLHTQNWEVTFSYTPANAKDTIVLKQYAEWASGLAPYFSCSLYSTMTIKYYKIANLFYPNGLDKNRPFYAKDIQTLRTWIEDVNKKHDCQLAIDDNGIIISRNKRFKLSEITDYIPPMSSYVFKH